MRIDALRVVSELAASQHNVFTRTQAAAHGVNRKHIQRLIHGDLATEMPGGGIALGAPNPGPTWLQRVIGAVLDHPGTVASHTTAARLDGLDGFEVFDSIELSVLRPRVVRATGITVHRVVELERCDLVTVNGIPCTNRARTLCDLGASVEPLMLERALDDVVRRGGNPLWLKMTAERLHRPGRTGTRPLLDALEAMKRRGRVRDSWFEKLVELCLDDPVIGTVERQFQLYDRDGRKVARFDLAVPDAMLGIEAHSRLHHFGAVAESSDEHRDQAAGELAWDVMYIGYGELRSPGEVRRRVQRRVVARRRLILGEGA